MSDERLTARVLHCHIQGERNRERIPKRWMDNIKEDIKDLGLRQAVDMTKQNKMETSCDNFIINQWLMEERKT